MTKTEKIRKARHDVELLQSGLQQVDVALEGAEEVAEIAAEARRRAPSILLAVAGVIALAAGISIVLRRRRRANDEAETQLA